MSATTSDAPTPTRRDRTHWLYLAVIAAVLLGIAVGFLAPDVAVELKPLGDGFVSLIQMMISPIIFCTIVLGVGSVAKAAAVGKVGGPAMGHFLVMSTVALVFGLVVGNLIDPGANLNLSDEAAKAGTEAAGEAAGSTVEFLLGVIPRRCSRPSRRARSCRPSWWHCRSASPFSRWETAASRSCAASATCSGWSSRSWP